MAFEFVSFQNRVLFAFLCTTLFILTVPRASSVDAASLRWDEKSVFDLATEAYLYAFPLVLMGLTERSMGAPVNAFVHGRDFPDFRFHKVVSPNVDTLYSIAWLDLSQGPVTLNLPNSEGRYYLIQMIDAWTNVFAAPGKRTVGSESVHFEIVGPQWRGRSLPGYEKIRSPTNRVWVIGRIFCDGSVADLKKAREFQDQVALHAFASGGGARSSKSYPRNSKLHPLQQLFEMDVATFFTTFAELMKSNLPPAQDVEMVRKLARVGIVPGKDLHWNKLESAVVQSFTRAFQISQKKAQSSSLRVGPAIHGWSYHLHAGNYGTDYFFRAHIARVALGANFPEDAIYPYAEVDEDGVDFNGNLNYVLHFEKDQIPPVQGFWSLTLYNAEHFLVENPHQRYAIRSSDPLVYNRNGSLDIYLRLTPPEKDQLVNWLPTPPGKFNLMMRLYWPEKRALNGEWKPVGVRVTPSMKMSARSIS